MFGNMKDMAAQLKLIQKLMRDPSVRTLLSNPKVQQVLTDPEFRRLVQSKDPEGIANYPPFAELRKDPELTALLGQIDLAELAR